MSASSAGMWWRCWLLSCVSRPAAVGGEATAAAATFDSSLPASQAHDGASWEAAATVLHQRRRHPAGDSSPATAGRSSSNAHDSKKHTTAPPPPSSTASAAVDAEANSGQRRRRRHFRLLAAWRGRRRQKHQESLPQVQPRIEARRPEQEAVIAVRPRRSLLVPGPAPTQPVCIARHRYSPAESDELSLAPGDCVLVSERSPDGWWRGQRLKRCVGGNCDGEEDKNDGVTGWFPSNHVAPMSAEAEAQAKAAAGGASSVSAQMPVGDRPLYRVRAQHRFAARHAEELSFAQGDVLDIVSEPEDDPDWLMAVDAHGQRRGLIPRNYVSAVAQSGDGAVEASTDRQFDAEATKEAAPGEDEPTLLGLPFYWGGVSRAAADELLMWLARPGQFLIRTGESNPLDLTLMIRAQTKSRNFKIRRLHQAVATAASQQQQQQQQQRFSYSIGQKQFSDLHDLVLYYSQHPIYRSPEEQCYLGRAFDRREFPALAGSDFIQPS